MDHIILTKRIGSLVVILNHSEFIFRIYIYFFCSFWKFFSCLKILLFDFHKEKLSCNADIKCLVVYNYLYWQNQQNFNRKIWGEKIFFYPSRFMKILWSISANWCFQKLLVQDWLCGGLIHLSPQYTQDFQVQTYEDFFSLIYLYESILSVDKERTVDWYIVGASYPEERTHATEVSPFWNGLMMATLTKTTCWTTFFCKLFQYWLFFSHYNSHSGANKLK